jgi:hypothetical protein
MQRQEQKKSTYLESELITILAHKKEANERKER